MFKKLFNSWYDKDNDKATSITLLVEEFKKNGTKNINAFYTEKVTFSSLDWEKFSKEKKEEILMNYRLAYLSESRVNWCPDLGTVLANDEVKEGLSERGGYPVIQKSMMQWSIRISAYSQRLLNGLEKVDFSNSLKEQQINWIGKSEGALIKFNIYKTKINIDVFTTRPDTIFGVSFLTLAPELDVINDIVSKEQKERVKNYIINTSKKSERERQANQGMPTGVFTGAYAIHPLNGENIPIWISEYVLSGYGTGAVMAVPAGDQRDHEFAKKFKINIPAIFKNKDTSVEAYAEKDVTYTNSSFVNGMEINKATELILAALGDKKSGTRKVNYRLRDAIFSRQRYWGEPFPIYYENNTPKIIEEDLVTLPKIDQYLPTPEGNPPLGRAKKEDWKVFKGERMELNTMPGWAGSSWYF
jgi:leucyl-tRNA synthetase